MRVSSSKTCVPWGTVGLPGRVSYYARGALCMRCRIPFGGDVCMHADGFAIPALVSVHTQLVTWSPVLASSVHFN